MTYLAPGLRGLRQPQTLRMKWSIFTGCCMILMIQGCSSMSRGVGRRLGSRVRLAAAQAYTAAARHVIDVVSDDNGPGASM